MKHLIMTILLTIMVSPAFAVIEPMFYFEHREDRNTAQENTGKEYPLIDEYRQVSYTGTFDTVTRGILIEKEFVVAAIDDPISPVDPIDPIEPLPVADPNLVSETNVPPVGDWIQVSDKDTFVSFDTERFSHLSSDEIGNLLIVTLVAATDNNGGTQEAFWSFGRTIDQAGLDPLPDAPPAVIEPEVALCEGTTKDQVDGALEQLINLTQAALDSNIETFNNNTTRIVHIAAELKLELEIARQVLNGKCEYR